MLPDSIGMPQMILNLSCYHSLGDLSCPLDQHFSVFKQLTILPSKSYMQSIFIECSYVSDIKICFGITEDKLLTLTRMWDVCILWISFELGIEKE